MNKSLWKAAVSSIIAVVTLLSLAFLQPGYFTNATYLGGLLLLEFLIVAIWLYRQIFFPVTIVTFLLAGVDLPVGSVWTSARWLVLSIGAFVGAAIVLKERRCKFGSFHALAFFSVLAASVSAAVSRFGELSALKVLSLFLLFAYAATGARLAVVGREGVFFQRLLTSCEIFVAIVGACYLMGREVMGNPNSLGAVMGVVAAPILLWGILLEQEPFAHKRRMFLYGVSMYLTFSSHARAALLAAVVSCGLLCVILRKFRLLAQGVAIIMIFASAVAIFQPEAFSRTVSTITSTVVFKGKDPSAGILASRQSPWQDTLDVIHDHFWFGTGFGTSDRGTDATEDLGKFSTSIASSTEHGSSYLAVTAWVGMLGIVPFFLLLGALLNKVVQTILWMARSANPSHAAVPLSMVILAGMIHAGFEDWLFAPGYYLCVFYWSMAFVLVDQATSLTVGNSGGVQFRRFKVVREDLRVVVPS